MSTDDSERAAAPITCEPSDLLIGNLLLARFAGDGEQPIAPRRSPEVQLDLSLQHLPSN